MTITTTPHAKLPFQHTIIGLLTTAAGRTFIAWERAGAAHNFGTHELFPSTFCEHGNYFSTRDEAMQDLAARAGFQHGETKAPRRRRRAPDYSHIDPAHIDPDTGAPYDNYETDSIEPHPFGGGISAGDY